MFTIIYMNKIKLFSKQQLQHIIQYNKINNFSIKTLIKYKKNELQKIITDNNLEIPDIIKPKEKKEKIKVLKIPANVLSKYSKKPYDVKQQTDFITKLNDDVNYKNSLNPMDDYYNKKIDKRERLSLVEHQIQFVKQLVLSDLRGGIFFTVWVQERL